MVPTVTILTPASASVIAASMALLSAVFVFYLNRKAAEIERKRTACAEAMADAIAWLELPYRVRRRQGDDKATLDALAERFHQLHERLLFHENWLRIEVPTAHPLFKTLVGESRAAALIATREAWEAPRISEPKDMNIGSLSINRAKVDGSVADFAEEARKRLRILPPW